MRISDWSSDWVSSDLIAAGVNGIIAFYLVTGGLGWLLIRHWEIGPMGLVYASAAGMVVAALLQGGWLLYVSLRLPRQSSGAFASLPPGHRPCHRRTEVKIGRAACRERVFQYV